MAVLLEMDAELEARLNEAAQKRGMSAAEYLQALALEKLQTPEMVASRLSGREERERLIAEHTGANATNMRDLRTFRGVGKHISLGMDAQEYVNQLRDEWDDHSGVASNRMG